MPLRPAAPADLQDALTRAQLAVNDAIRACHDAAAPKRSDNEIRNQHSSYEDKLNDAEGDLVDFFDGYLCALEWVLDVSTNEIRSSRSAPDA